MSWDEEALETAANGGMMDFEKWPGMVEPLLDRLEYIIFNVFPMPKPPPEAPQFNHHNHHHLPSHPSLQLQEANSIPSSSNKENAYPPELQTPPRPTASSTAATSASTERVPDSQPQPSSAQTNDPLPAPLMLLLNNIKSTMRSYFTSKPPHTIQRLVELILRPSSHYRTLPAYLRAVDRVVCVTSTADNFSLQMQASASASGANGMMNGTFESGDHVAGGDESLGGALLTPIPWLSNTASLEEDVTTSLNQGLVPDQEVPTDHQLHHEAEPVATTQHPAPQSHHPSITAENEVADPTSPPPDTSEELPHARGPPIVGVEDMGLQDGKDVEMPLSNTEDGSEGGQTAHNDQQAKDGEQGDSKGEDTDGDLILDDARNGGQTASDTEPSKGAEQGTDKKD